MSGFNFCKNVVCLFRRCPTTGYKELVSLHPSIKSASVYRYKKFRYDALNLGIDLDELFVIEPWRVINQQEVYKARQVKKPLTGERRSLRNPKKKPKLPDHERYGKVGLKTGKLSQKDVDKVKHFRELGWSYRKIGAHFGVSYETIRRLKDRKTIVW